MAEETSPQRSQFAGCGCIILLVVVGFVGMQVEQYLNRPPAPQICVVNATDSDVELLIDGKPAGTFSPQHAGEPTPAGLDAPEGECRIVLRAGEEVILDETISLEHDERYLAYTGGRWMLRSEVFYSTSEFLTPPNLVSFCIDGVLVPGEFGQIAELDGEQAFRPTPPVPLEIEPDLDHVELHTRPVFMLVSGFLPGETSEESVEIETAPNSPFASTTKNVFTLFDAQTQTDHESIRTLEWLMAPAAEESETE